MSDPARFTQLLLSLVISFSVHVAAQTLTPASLSFGSKIVGTTTAAQSATLTNTQSVPLTVSSIATTGDFAASSNCPAAPVALAAGANCKVFLTFTPSSLGARSGTLTIKDDAVTGSQTATLTGTGIAPVALSPPALWLGSQAIGTTSPAKSLTLKNNQLIPVTITGITTSGDYRQTNTCPISPASLGSGATCIINVTFTPTTTGSRVGALSVGDNAANSPQTANLTGTGLIPVALSTTVLSFGSQALNKTTAAQNITLRNNLPLPLTISGISSSGDFAVTTTCPKTPNALAAGGSCTLSITFTPTVLGPRVGMLSITDDGASSPQTVNLQGNGTLTGLSGITVTPQNPSIAVGAQQQFTATGAFSDGSAREISRFVVWTSSNRNIATVGSGGLAMAVAAGTATINASYAGIIGTSALTVSSGARTLKSISVSPTAITLAKGQTQQYTAVGTYSDNTTADLTGSATWRSSVPSIASINPAGLATGLAAGATTISATSGSVSGSGTMTVTVAPPTVASLRVTPDKASVAIGTLQQLMATGTYSDGSTQDLTGTVIWSSSSTIATVSAAGMVRGVGAGLPTITATLGSISGSSTITVAAMTWQRYPSPAWDGPVSAIARATDGDVFLGANGTGVYKSSDGHVWTLMGSPAEPGIESLLWSATSLYAGTHDGVFVSTDDGRTWTRFGAGLRSGACVFALLNANGAFFAATDQGLYRMPVGFSSWSAVVNGNEFRALFASSTGLLLAGTTSGGNGGGVGGDIYTSNDGVTWTRIGIANAWSFRSFGQDANGTLYAGAFFKCFAPGGIYTSVDGGKTWAGPSLGAYSVQAITTVGSTVYLGTREGLLILGPQTWQAVPNPSGKAILSLSYPFLGSDGIYRVDDNTHPQLDSTPEVTQVLRDASGTTYWRSSYFGIWSSTDGYIGPTGVEAAWHLDNLMFLNAAGELVAFEQTTIYHRVGRDWIKAQFPTSPVQGRFYCYVVLPDGSILVSDVNDRLWRSTDGGSSFVYSGTTANGSGVLFGLLYANNALYAASELNNIIVSSDYGKTWTALPQFLPGTHNVNTYAVAVTTDGTLLGARAGGNGDGCVFRYVNGVWQRSDKGIPAYQSVYGLYSTPGAVYALTERALYQSVDDGQTWGAFSTPTFFPAYTAEFRPITMTTMDDGHLVLGVHWEGAGAYISGP